MTINPRIIWMVMSFPKEGDRKNRLTIRERNVNVTLIDKSHSFTFLFFVRTGQNNANGCVLQFLAAEMALCSNKVALFGILFNS